MKAVIDLGTNTFHLMVASVEENALKVHCKLQIPVMIGEKGINDGFIAELAYERGMKALSLFKDQLLIYPVTDLKVFGTSAIRDARNGLQFIEEAENRFGFKIKAISGELEASLIYEGVRRSIPITDQPILVMDIGGGSVEFSIGLKEQIWWKKSYAIGAARLMDKFHHHDPILTEEVLSLQYYLEKELVELKQEASKYQIGILVGAAGSFETLHDVLQLDFNCKAKQMKGMASEITLENLQFFCDKMISFNHAERKSLQGMLIFRSEMIVVSAILMDVVARITNVKRVIISEYALKEGMLFAAR